MADHYIELYGAEQLGNGVAEEEPVNEAIVVRPEEMGDGKPETADKSTLVCFCTAGCNLRAPGCRLVLNYKV